MQTKHYNVIFHDDQNFPLRVKYDRQEVTLWHTHQFTEVVIILSGSGIHETKFSKSSISSGDVLVIPKNGSHRYAKTNNLELMNLLFDQEKLPVPLIDLYRLPGFNALFSIKNDYFNENRLYPRFHLNGKQFEEIKQIMIDMKEENINMVPGYRCCLLGHFMVLLGQLSRLYTEDISTVNESSFKIGEAVSFINSNYSEDIKLKDILQHAKMPRSSFMRQFHQAIGMAPINYLLQIRIAKACKLLRDSNINISEIAYKVGFNDSNYFARQFRRISGLTPREFRQSITTK